MLQHACLCIVLPHPAYGLKAHTRKQHKGLRAQLSCVPSRVRMETMKHGMERRV